MLAQEQSDQIRLNVLVLTQVLLHFQQLQQEQVQLLINGNHPPPRQDLGLILTSQHQIPLIQVQLLRVQHTTE